MKTKSASPASYGSHEQAFPAICLTWTAEDQDEPFGPRPNPGQNGPKGLGVVCEVHHYFRPGWAKELGQAARRKLSLGQPIEKVPKSKAQA
jgi:hypothetical protein